MHGEVETSKAPRLVWVAVHGPRWVSGYGSPPEAASNKSEHLGDILWILGWVIVTGNTHALIIPAVAASAFTLLFIPTLATYLEHRYGAEFEDWARRTPRLVPMVW